MLGIECRALHMIGNFSTTEVQYQSLVLYLIPNKICMVEIVQIKKQCFSGKLRSNLLVRKANTNVICNHSRTLKITTLVRFGIIFKTLVYFFTRAIPVLMY